MELLTKHFSPLMCGVGFFALFFIWRKSASRWTTWFPLLKKTLEWSLIAVAVALAFWAAGIFLAAGESVATFALAFAAGLAAPHLVFGKKLGKVEKEETTRGSKLAPAETVAKKVRATKTPSQIMLGGVPIPVNAEPYHFLTVGSTGTGKSVVIGSLLESLRARGDTVILVDSGGDFLSKHYDAATDFVFNPYDERCVGWSPTAEMQGAWDATAMARSIVPDGTGEAKEWNGYAQTFIAAVLRKLWENQRLTLKDFLYFVQAAPLAELAALLEGTAAASQLAAEKTFGSIRTIAGNYVASYDYLPHDRDTFSISDMIRAEHSGVLFVTYRDDQLDSLRNLIACLLDVAARSILSLNPDPNRRVWLIIDEFASIGKVQSIEAVATKARKAGGCLVLGIQSISQLKDRYGEHGAQTILSCLSTWLVLRCSDADTAEYMSKFVGEAEVKRTQQGSSTSDTGENQSWNEQSSTQRVVLPSQIQAFANLSGLLKLAGDYPVCNIKLALPKNRDTKYTAFDARDFRKRPLLALTAPKSIEALAQQAAAAATQAANAPVVVSSPPPSEQPRHSAAEQPKERPQKLSLSSPSNPRPDTVSTGFSSARNLGRPTAPQSDDREEEVSVKSAPKKLAVPATTPADTEQFEHELTDEAEPEVTTKKPDAPKQQPQQPVQSGKKKRSKEGPGKPPAADPKAPQLETLSSRRRRAEAQQAAQVQAEATAPTAPAPESKREKSSGRELRDLLR